MGNELLLLKDTPENDLIFRSFKAGSENAFQIIYNGFYNQLYKYGTKQYLDDGFTIESIIQDSLLKVWEFREKTTSMLHIYRLLRLSLRWDVYKHYRTKAYQIGNKTVNTDGFENIVMISTDPEKEEEVEIRNSIDSERLMAIRNAIPYLSLETRKIIEMYIDQGLSIKEIGEHYKRRHNSINSEIKAGIEDLKRMIISIQFNKFKKIPVVKKNTYYEILPELHAEIYFRRKDCQFSFEKISTELSIPITDVINKYEESLDKIKKANNGAEKNNNNQKNPITNRFGFPGNSQKHMGEPQ